MVVSIRRFTPADLSPLARLLADPLVMRYLEPPYSAAQTAAFLQTAGLGEPPRIYAAEHGGSFIGYVIFHPFTAASFELGWVLLPEAWGRGYACALTQLMLQKCEALGKDVVIECVPAQRAARHIAEKYGFVYEGESGGLCVYRRAYA